MRARIPFVGPAYEARSLNVDSQRAINCFLEMDNASPRAPIALYGTPGTVLQFTLPMGPVRGCSTDSAYAYWVAGNTVYRADTGNSVTSLGTIGSSTGPVSMAFNGTQTLIVDGVGGWLITAGVLTQITDTDFPNGVTRCTFQDGYFIVTGKLGSQQFFINEVAYEGSGWNGLDFASAEGSPDNTIGVISDHRELWLFGSNSAEVWVNTGNSDFPFQRSGNTFIEHGCAAGATVAKADNTVFWLGTDDRGSGIVWRADGYTPMRVSTHAIEKLLASCTLSAATAFTYQQEGHIFYVLNLPEVSLAYDAATQQWHERAWMDPSTGALSRWRQDCCVFFNNQHFVGDYDSGKVCTLDLDINTDAGDAIKRLRSTISNENLQLRMFYEYLQVDMETGIGNASGSDPQLMMRFSDDGGHTWSNLRTVSLGTVGQYNARAKFARLGSGRNRVFEVSMTDDAKFVVLGAVAEAQAGSA
jgi:hypothetical protein